MAMCVALLRGINVSGKNMIKMAELKQLFESMGFGGVQTYINSGNVIFESASDEASMQREIEAGIESKFGLTIPVILRTSEELERIMEECPYKSEVAPDGKNVNVGLLRQAPPPEAIDRLAPYKGPDDYQVIGREIHLLFRQGQADSKLGNNLQKLGVPVTVRNWNTMNKLCALAKDMQG
ncbi:DUF1697 domain-containing protein [Cohnella pontilimi]|uniref:DUF1697 domain-containing protein n=1 Tax=Cohnella pontilimi TaxID=2564100 RepID=A0A4U0F9E5_9BACL|nr:DUF1697 domain-containing protein [Cohnella pontilimi]TJY41118.1 DUF1697 domain-containing protein [Cohnella pontilimi]